MKQCFVTMEKSISDIPTSFVIWSFGNEYISLKSSDTFLSSISNEMLMYFNNNPICVFMEHFHRHLIYQNQ